MPSSSRASGRRPRSSRTRPRATGCGCSSTRGPASGATSPRADIVAAAGEPEEIELKLAVGEPKVVRDLIRRPPPEGVAGFLPVGPARVVTCVDHYFDTASLDGMLRLGGIRARLRVQDGTVIVAVKASIATDGAVSRRVELQGPAVDRLEPLSWPASAARARILDLAGESRLVEIAAIRQRRLQRSFARAGTTVEISLDELSAMDGRRILARRVEVEAELLDGDAGLLQDLAGALGELPGITAASGSKLAFALAARAPSAGDPLPQSGDRGR